MIDWKPTFESTRGGENEELPAYRVLDSFLYRRCPRRSSWFLCLDANALLPSHFLLFLGDVVFLGSIGSYSLWVRRRQVWMGRSQIKFPES